MFTYHCQFSRKNSTCLTGCSVHKVLHHKLHIHYISQVVHFSPDCQAESDVVFLVDTTRYVGERNLAKIRGFLRSVVDKLALHNNQTRVGLVTFDGPPLVERYLSEPSDREDIIGAINALQYGGEYPFTAEAMLTLTDDVFTERNGDRPDVDNYALLIAGGLLFSEFDIPVAHKPKAANIHVFGIGIGLSATDRDSLNEVVPDPDQDVFVEDNAEQLENIVEQIVTLICQREHGDTHPGGGGGGIKNNWQKAPAVVVLFV